MVSQEAHKQCWANKISVVSPATKLYSVHSWGCSEARACVARWERWEVWGSSDLVPLSGLKFEQLGDPIPTLPNASSHHVIRLRRWFLVCHVSMPSKVVLAALFPIVTIMVTVIINSKQHPIITYKMEVHWYQSRGEKWRGTSNQAHPDGADCYKHGLAVTQELPANNLNDSKASSVVLSP